MTEQLQGVMDRLGGRRRRRAGPRSVMAVASGKGGVGVSLVAAALALRSAHAGLRTLLVDTDPWIDVQRIWLGVARGSPLVTLRGGGDPESLVVRVSPLLDLVSFGSGEPADRDLRPLARRVPDVFSERDVVIVDSGSGIGGLERALDLQPGSMLFVTGADPVGLAATHAMLKAAAALSEAASLVLFNRVESARASLGEAVLMDGGRRFLGFQPVSTGSLPPDRRLARGLGGGALLPESLEASDLVKDVDRLMRQLPPWKGDNHGR